MDTFTGQEIVGKKVKNFRRLYEHEDWEILFEDGAELRIFGNAMMPSFLGHNVKGMPAGKNAPQSEAKDSGASRLASPACSPLLYWLGWYDPKDWGPTINGKNSFGKIRMSWCPTPQNWIQRVTFAIQVLLGKRMVTAYRQPSCLRGAKSPENNSKSSS